MVPEILSATGRIFCHFGPFFALLPLWQPKISKFWKAEKNYLETSSLYTSVPKMMIICYTVPEIWCMTDVIVIFHFGLFFALLPPNSPKNQNFEKMKKVPGDIIILHKCTKNHDYMLYCSWDKARDRCNCYFSFWAIFCPFTPLTAKKIKILKKWKNIWIYHHFTYVYQKL